MEQPHRQSEMVAPTSKWRYSNYSTEYLYLATTNMKNGGLNMSDTISNKIIDEADKTPIEIALGIDENGYTTARSLYEFLSGEKSNFSRWSKKEYRK